MNRNRNSFDPPCSCVTKLEGKSRYKDKNNDHSTKSQDFILFLPSPGFILPFSPFTTPLSQIIKSANMSDPNSEAEKNIEIWKVKKLIKGLEAARGNGTSMISLIIRM